MKRKIESKLLEWKNKVERKPLLINGARQVGKTYSIVEFGKKYYSDIVYFNFEGNSPLIDIFKKDLNPDRIILELESLSGNKINKGNTLIIFDEIQECEGALTSLKYFNEKANDYHIIAAGSLLGLAVNRGHYSFPVGKVDILEMYPLDFEEFLLAFEKDSLIEQIKESYLCNNPVSEVEHKTILDYYYKYLAIGGMPAVVSAYLNKKDFDFVRIEQNEIQSSYYGDMTKYTDLKESNKIIATYRSIPSQLAKENKKFQYKLIGSGARASTYEYAIEWLVTAGIVYKCTKIRKGEVPLKMSEDFLSYKIYMSDIGLLSASLGLNISNILSDNISSDAKGALAENYVIQQLVASGIKPHYWESEGKAEVDFVIQNSDVIPIECKYAESTQSKSLNVFISEYTPKYAIRISTKNFGFENNIKSVPLYAVFCI